jgi:DNA-binding GntR family transcriptional regulator
MPQNVSSAELAERLIDAVLAQRLTPGTRLSEQQLADLFGVSRTIVREALTRLSVRGVVEVNSRRGWFVVQPSPNDAREAFEARRVIETGLLLEASHGLTAAGLRTLHAHLARERRAIAGDDAAQRSWLLGDFHVCLAECLGNHLLADILRDLTTRTHLISMLYQSSHEAQHSCAEHEQIVAALEAGATQDAVRLMREHLQHIADELLIAAPPDPLDSMRSTLAPIEAAVTRRRQAGTARGLAPAPAKARRPAGAAPAAATRAKSALPSKMLNTTQSLKPAASGKSPKPVT